MKMKGEKEKENYIEILPENRQKHTLAGNRIIK